MGQDATATLSEIEAARQRLERDIDELDRRARPEHDLPEQAQRLGIAAATAGAGIAVLVGITRWRLHARRQHRHARRQAELLADVLEERGMGSGRWTRSTPGPEDLSREAASGAVVLIAAASSGAAIAHLVRRR